MKTRKILPLILVMLCIASLSIAGDITDRLIVNEVYLDEKDPGRNWIEIYNPTESPLIMEGFRLSHIRSLNILPGKTDEEEYSIEPHGYILLCADRNTLDTAAAETVETIEISDLKTIRDGGFIGVFTKTGSRPVADGVRYGKPELSSHIALLSDCSVVPFSENGETYSRISYAELAATTGTPGKDNIR